MTMAKHICHFIKSDFGLLPTLLLFMFIPKSATAQSGTNSPYSQFGIGMLADQATGYNRAMGGVAYGMHETNQVNPQNPASYAMTDSLTFLFDVGAALQVTNFKEGNRKLNANNANFEYATMAFRVAPRLGMSVGLLPYSNIGYSYYSTDKVANGSSTSYTTSYNGSGGMRVMYIGAGWSPIKNVSIGANIGYIWGSYSRSVVNQYSDENANTIGRYYQADMNSYKLDVGLQYTFSLGKKNCITLGATYSPGHTLGGTAALDEISNATNVSDTTTYSHGKAFAIPTTIGAGLAWYHGKKIRLGVDYTLQQWSKCVAPDLTAKGYEVVKGMYKDRSKIAIGGDFVNNPTSRKYLDRVHVKAGASYATPYLMINGKEGPKEIAATIGFGLPISNSWNNRSMLNISAQWVQNSATGMIRENAFRINIGITFNEKWFQKWKLE